MSQSPPLWEHQSPINVLKLPWLHLSDRNNLDNLPKQITGQRPSVRSTEYDTLSIHGVGPDTQSRLAAFFFAYTPRRLRLLPSSS